MGRGFGQSFMGKASKDLPSVRKARVSEQKEQTASEAGHIVLWTNSQRYKCSDFHRYLQQIP